ncbi:MAG: radical SAM protein [Candidatus Omnitrophota bacterium]|nr:MAG: radical SAM protein [Candidatus Omnitrophota bacterium]
MGKLYKENRYKRRPLRAIIELTYKCNHRCLHCYNSMDKNKSELSTKEILSVLDQLIGMGTVRVTFTGGEIFTRPDIMDIVFYSRSKGFQVTLMTNGSLITEEIADKLISRGINRFEVSFPGATKATFEETTQTEGSFERIISVTKMLRRKGIRPCIKTCITKINLREVSKIMDLARELNVPFKYSPFVIPRLDLGQEPVHFSVDPEEFLDIRKMLKGLRNKNERKSSFPKKRKSKHKQGKPGFWEKECIFGCMAGHTAIFINPYGEMKVCLMLPEPSYDLRKGSVKEGWGKMKEFVDRIKPPQDWQCVSCEYHDWCSWCPGRGYLNTGNIFGCPDYFKEMAKRKRERYEKNIKARTSL